MLLREKCCKCGSTQYRDLDPATGGYAIKCLAGHLNAYETADGEHVITVTNTPGIRPWAFPYAS